MNRCMKRVMVFKQPDKTKCHCCDAINFGEPAPDCPDCKGTGRPAPKPVTDVEAKLEILRGLVGDLPGELLYYGLKDPDIKLTPEDVVALQRGGHLTIKRLVVWFAEALKKDWPA